MLAHVGREGDAGGLEDPADLTGNHGTGSDALAVLFDGGLVWRLSVGWRGPNSQKNISIRELKSERELEYHNESH